MTIEMTWEAWTVVIAFLAGFAKACQMIFNATNKVEVSKLNNKVEGLEREIEKDEIIITLLQEKRKNKKKRKKDTS